MKLTNSMLWVIGDLENSSFIPPDIYTFGFSGHLHIREKRLLASSSLAACSHIWTRLWMNGFSWKFFIGDLCGNMLRKSIFGQNQRKIWDTYQEDQSTFYGCRRQSCRKSIVDSNMSWNNAKGTRCFISVFDYDIDILETILWQVHRHFQNEFSVVRDPVLPLSILSILSLP